MNESATLHQERTMNTVSYTHLAVSMTALYNAKWAELEEAGRRTGAPMTEDEMHALCMQSVTRALEMVAQPLTQSQKSMLGTRCV